MTEYVEETKPWSETLPDDEIHFTGGWLRRSAYADTICSPFVMVNTRRKSPERTTVYWRDLQPGDVLADFNDQKVLRCERITYLTDGGTLTAEPMNVVIVVRDSS